MSGSRDRALVALYDWMVDELVEVADEACSDDRWDDDHRELMRTTVWAVAQYVSRTRGSGGFRLLSLLSAADVLGDESAAVTA